MSADYGEGQSVNGGAVHGNDPPPFTGQGADPRRQARSVLFWPAAQADQAAALRVHDAEEAIGGAHAVMLVELQVCRKCRMAQVLGPLVPARSAE
jgi:uncharacterized protein (UPF0548 family)